MLNEWVNKRDTHVCKNISGKYQENVRLILLEKEPEGNSHSNFSVRKEPSETLCLTESAWWARRCYFALAGPLVWCLLNSLHFLFIQAWHTYCESKGVTSHQKSKNIQKPFLSSKLTFYTVGLRLLKLHIQDSLSSWLPIKFYEGDSSEGYSYSK